MSPLALVVSIAMLIPVLQGGAAEPLTLGTAETFAVLAGTGITNTGASTIVGDVGTSPTPAETGFGTVTLTGTNHGNDGTAAQAKNDLAAAYAVAVGTPPTATLPSELGGTTVTPGVYNSAAGTFAITGTVTLDTQGDPNAVFIFQAATTLVTAAASAVTFADGGSACNVFWQVGSSATLGANTQLLGSILAFTSITSGAGSNITGRLLAEGGAVTIDSNNITVPACTAPATTTLPATTTTTLPATTTTLPATTTTTLPATTTTTLPATTTTTLPGTTTTLPATTTTTLPGTATTLPASTTTTSLTPVTTPTPSITDPGATTTTTAAATLPGTATSTPTPTTEPPGSAAAKAAALAFTGSDRRAPILGGVILASGLLLLIAVSGRRKRDRREPTE